MLKKRTITGIFFAIIVLAAIYGGLISAILFFGLVLLFVAYEFSKIVRRDIQNYWMQLNFLFIIVPLILSFYLKIPEPIYNAIVILTCIIIIAFILFTLAGFGANFLEKYFLLTSLAYLGLPFFILRLSFLNEPYSWQILIAIILLIWSSDTFAYLIGSLLGKHKLIPKVSPGKTWEGFLGAGAATVLVSYLLYLWLGEFPLVFYLILGPMVWLIGSFGDLFESFLKRHFGIKDSGNFLPGHGGFLDRFDSFIFVIPFSALLIKIIEGFI